MAGKYQKNWIDKLITHTRDQRGDFGSRVMLHFGIGYLMGATFPLSIPVIWLFIAYEENEDKHEQDKAWKDYAGAIAGAVAGLLQEVALVVLLLIKWGLICQ